MVTGYKALNADMSAACGNMTYEAGKWYEIEGELKMCENGFHFCKNILDLPKYWSVYCNQTRIFEVEADRVLMNEATKTVAEKIRLVREIPRNEWDTEEMRLSTIQLRGGWSLRFIDNPSQVVQLAAIERDAYAIQFIKNPTKTMQLNAVKSNGCAIQFIENPDKEVQLEAVKISRYAIDFIANPDTEVQAEAQKHIFEYSLE